MASDIEKALQAAATAAANIYDDAADRPRGGATAIDKTVARTAVLAFLREMPEEILLTEPPNETYAYPLKFMVDNTPSRMTAAIEGKQP